VISGVSHGRDLDGRYAASPLKEWFDSLKSGKGPCCSDASGVCFTQLGEQAAVFASV